MKEIYFELEGFKFLTSGLQCKEYEDDWFMGIIYTFPNAIYDIFLNKIGWARIYIKYNDASAGVLYKDLPLNEGTIKLLPESIKAEKINNAR